MDPFKRDSEMDQNYYQILQIRPGASHEEVLAAYRRLARLYHPDTNKDPGANLSMQRINEAFEVLSNPVARALYNHDHPEWNPRQPIQPEKNLWADDAHVVPPAPAPPVGSAGASTEPIRPVYPYGPSHQDVPIIHKTERRPGTHPLITSYEKPLSHPAPPARPRNQPAKSSPVRTGKSTRTDFQPMQNLRAVRVLLRIMAGSLLLALMIAFMNLTGRLTESMSIFYLVIGFSLITFFNLILEIRR
jgi:hypothetical protein